MGAVITIDPFNTKWKKWNHKLFKCPTFWKSLWRTIRFSKPYYRCSGCNKAMHCFWDGNDNDNGIDYCDSCDNNLKSTP